MVNFCGVKYYDTEVYCNTINGGGGWLVVQRRLKTLTGLG